MRSLFSLPLLLASGALAGSGFPHNRFKRDTASAPAPPANASQVDMVASSWFTSWHAQNFTLDDVSWDKYTHITFAFAITTPDVSRLEVDGADVLVDLVKTAHSKNVKALASIGGWTGSRWFSSNVGSAENRTAFVKTIVDFANQYGVDGIDFDWEYPNKQGVGCNVAAGGDAANYLAFLQELRADETGKKLILTAAASPTPWNDATKTPLTDVSGFAKVLDWIAIMNYDIWGSWSDTVGPNAPLNDTCAPPAAQQGSAVTFVNEWTKAGMPPHQIVLAVASYGHSFSVDVSDAIECGDDGEETIAMYPAFNKQAQPKGDAWDDPSGPDVCGNPQGPGGNVDFWGLIVAGYLNANGTAQAGIDYRFDECSQTAYVYDETTGIMVSFDDAPAFNAKGKFIHDQNLRGFALWETGGDSDDILLDSIRTGAGFDDANDC